MSNFIANTTSKYLTCDNSQKAIPIQTVSSNTVDKWYSGLSDEQARWAKSNGFKAAAEEVLKFSDDQGEISSIVLGTGNQDSPVGIAGYAKLAKQLPAGFYRIADQDDQRLASIGWALAQYQFDRYKEEKNQNNAVLVLSNEQLLKEASSIVNSCILVRDLVNTPACDMGPSHMADVMKELAGQYSAQFSEVVGDALIDKGYNTIHAVGRAASNQPRLLELLWGREDAPKLTLVGKGVCFDTGGLDLKSAAGMRIMKKDMGGAAHTLGIAQMIMDADLDVRLRLLIPAVENNVSSNAYRPGDIIRTYKGTTVEVGNTDAEGRLVMCDALALAGEENPDLLMDFATLTGAARVAMGTDVVPFFTDNDDIASALAKSSIEENDPIWRLPMYEPYKEELKSAYADLHNIGSGPYGGAITAALFLKHFVDEPQNWVHFDMMAWNMKARATCPEGGEAMAIRAVFNYLKARYS